MNRALASFATVAAFLASGCAATPNDIERWQVVRLGVQRETPLGTVFVIDVQGEFRLIRTVPPGAGTITGGYEDVFAIPREQVHFNRWLDVARMPGLEVAIVSPTEVAFRVKESPGAPK
jgi:hypothetical protein